MFKLQVFLNFFLQTFEFPSLNFGKANVSHRVLNSHGTCEPFSGAGLYYSKTTDNVATNKWSIRFKRIIQFKLKLLFHVFKFKRLKTVRDHR